jgi:hypothetical protein
VCSQCLVMNLGTAAKQKAGTAAKRAQERPELLPRRPVTSK